MMHSVHFTLHTINISWKALFISWSELFISRSMHFAIHIFVMRFTIFSIHPFHIVPSSQCCLESSNHNWNIGAKCCRSRHNLLCGFYGGGSYKFWPPSHGEGGHKNFDCANKGVKLCHSWCYIEHSLTNLEVIGIGDQVIENRYPSNTVNSVVWGKGDYKCWCTPKAPSRMILIEIIFILW